MDECISVVFGEMTGYTLSLQEYATYYYLRVEDTLGGFGVLKTRLSKSGEILKSFERPPEDEQDFEWIQWAQLQITGT